ncbi:MAG: hypothetical protein M3319_11395 [Actinomycetota bacterium]|nr:hypothetical protein [Actinomycetota bacterium]MDQ3901002.1 hypothetical protein [Actinomycetota bacterium]
MSEQLVECGSRSRPMSLMLSAPATIPATSATIFAAAFRHPSPRSGPGQRPVRRAAPGRQRDHRTQPRA